jgi:uncharacterized protein (TIGR04255 family)
MIQAIAMKKLPPARIYSAAPIISAIIELRFDSPVSDQVRENVSKKLAQHYPLHEEIVQHFVQVQAQAHAVNTQAIIHGRISRRMNADANEIVNVGSETLSTELTAPYPGWDSLFGRLKSDWSTAKKVWGYRKIQRIGVRFINRIDLQNGVGGVVDYEKYLNLRINLPEDFPPIARYDLAFQLDMEDIKCGATIRSGIEPPAVPGSTSFSLDLDVFRIVDVPQQEKDVYKLLAGMRSAKNNLFETFITDAAREVFDAAL